MIAASKLEPDWEDEFDQLAEQNPEALLADGLERAYIGVTMNQHHTQVACYDFWKCVEILEADGMTEDEAIEFLEFNTLGAYVGDHGPLFIGRFSRG